LSNIDIKLAQFSKAYLKDCKDLKLTLSLNFTDCKLEHPENQYAALTKLSKSYK
jgi:hypothetical protein